MGLTKHVSDERIQQRLATLTSAKQACEDLLQEALDGGGSDNITIIVGRAVRRTRGRPFSRPPSRASSWGAPMTAPLPRLTAALVGPLRDRALSLVRAAWPRSISPGI